ncbi:metallophosphoesterase family protein [Saccharicrinis sp. 156]|uniref:metallophosphoesterase family protein n=1 Tax=Saccharicrinis sp. 156 TaxID=3417574 RepID=UPI003D32C84C
MKFERKPMVGWFDVAQLMSTGVKAVVSVVFGSYSDKREMQAFARQDQPFDLSDKEELWIDYISDLGDGFNPTYTMAHLMAQDEIQVNNKNLPRGDILVMGGDEVYPTPEIHEYKNRLQGPYNAAFPWIDEEKQAKELKPKLFVIPGNHDWYDGLTNFMRLFCQGRALGNWLTQQKRSYFALQLPHRYWLLGIDIQLMGDIDEPQLSYFKEVAGRCFQSGDKIILCTAQPTWVYGSTSGKFDDEERLNFFIESLRKEGEKQNAHFHIEVILTGDLHHYSRYEKKDVDGKISQLITAGGGGAFMHPTHFLKDKFSFPNESKAELKCTFPNFKQSKNLSWRNLLFPFYNWSFCLFLAAIHILTSWIIQSNNVSSTGTTFMETVAELAFSISNIDNYLSIIWKTVQHSPSVFLLNAVLFLGILFFTDVSLGLKKWNLLLGGFFHATAQITNLYCWIWVFSIWNLNILHLDINQSYQALLFGVEMMVLGGLSVGIIFGIYLSFSILVLKNHANEGSSSYRHEGFKNFLRIHLAKDKLTIYPIGLKNIVTNWKNVGTVEKPKFEGDEIQYNLLEDKPIEINFRP